MLQFNLRRGDAFALIDETGREVATVTISRIRIFGEGASVIVKVHADETLRIEQRPREQNPQWAAEQERRRAERDARRVEQGQGAGPLAGLVRKTTNS